MTLEARIFLTIVAVLIILVLVFVVAYPVEVDWHEIDRDGYPEEEEEDGAQ